MESKSKSNDDYLNDEIEHLIKYHGENFRFERAKTDSLSIRHQLRSGYGRKGYKVHFSKWRENKGVILVYISDSYHPELVI